MRNILKFCILSSMCSFCGGMAAADTGGGSNLMLNLTIERGCNIDFGGDALIVFPKFTFLSSPVFERGNFKLICTVGYQGAVDVSLNSGSVNPSDSVADRKLYLNGAYGKEGDNFLKFQVYVANSNTDIWGDGTQGTQVYHIPAEDIAQSRQFFPFTVALLAQDTKGKTIGEYSNTLTVTFTY